jgi:hypothetical protein
MDAMDARWSSPHVLRDKLAWFHADIDSEFMTPATAHRSHDRECGANVGSRIFCCNLVPLRLGQFKTGSCGR